MLRIRPFRQLWITFGLSSLGDWLGLLATSVFAAGQVSGSFAQGAAFGGVVVMKLLPALVLLPLAGLIADRFDRRLTMVWCDVARFALFVSIPLSALAFTGGGAAVAWALIATFLVEAISLIWIPAKEAAVPNLVPGRLESANQVQLITTYGIAPVLGALLFAGVARLVSAVSPGYAPIAPLAPASIALYLNGLTFLAAAIVVYFIREVSGKPREHVKTEKSLLASLISGGRFMRRTPLLRGLTLGIIGAFAAGGVVIGTARFYAAGLGAGDAAFGLLFAALFIGLGLGTAFGPKLVRELSRRRWFALSIMLAGGAVALLCVAPHLSIALPLVVLVGVGAGMAFLSGTTLLGSEIEDAVRGRAIAFVQVIVRVVLMAAIALASILVGWGGMHRIGLGPVAVSINAANILLLVAGVLAIFAGVLALRRMDDRRGVPVLPDLIGALRGRPLGMPQERAAGGLFVVFEGGEGAGKSTQVIKLAAWLRLAGLRCTVTREPGATAVGARIRGILLDPRGDKLAERSEALLYAADRAEHVSTVIRPALAEGAVVVCDRFIDSSLAYQGAGRSLPVDEIGWLSAWATGGLLPDLVIVLDVPPEVGLARVFKRGTADRLEGEDQAFHSRVRTSFLDLASADRKRYLVIDATRDPDQIAVQVQRRVATLLPSAPEPHPIDDQAATEVVAASEPTRPDPALDEFVATTETADLSSLRTEALRNDPPTRVLPPPGQSSSPGGDTNGTGSSNYPWSPSPWS